MCLIVEGDDENAIRDFTKSLELKPAQAKAYHYRGLAKKYQADTLSACDDLKKAKELGFAKSEEELTKINCR